jgi:type IV pilus assembly protein PilY1
MKTTNLRLIKNAFIAAALALAAPAGFGAFDPVNDDTDIFLADPSFNAERPNVLIIMDNTANWNQPFAAEKSALVNVVGTLSDGLNVGIGMFTETGGGNGGNDGMYIRYAVRQLTATNKTAFQALVNSLDSNGDKSNGGKAALAMYEAYLYYAGLDAYGGSGKAKRDYAGNTTGGPSGAVPGSFPGNAFADGSSTRYVSPIVSPCQKNFIIYISNGKASDNSSDLSTSLAGLTAANGGIAPSQITLSNVSPESSSQQGNWSDEWAKWMSINDCNQTISGVQTVVTYTIDVGPSVVIDNSVNGAGWTTLLKSMAASSGGKYFPISNSDPNEAQAIQNALTTIFNEVQAVNSVFAATTLPVSVNVRGTNLNQVYIGVFRPDANKLPRWLGNLKMYKLGVDTATQTLFLADANNNVASNSSTGFISSGATSFWTTGSTFWTFRGPTYATTDVGKQSDSPDGDLVEKGAAAERLRIKFPTSQGARNVYTCTSPSGGVCANGTTFSSTLASTNFSAGGTGYPPDNTDITAADLGAYLQYPVTSLQAAVNADGVTSTVTAVLGAIPSPSWSTGSQVVRVSGALPNSFNASPDPTIAGYTENSPSAGLTTFTYQISSVLPGNVAAVQTSTAHQMRTGDFVTVSGATPAVYNVANSPISVVNPTRFTYTLSANASGPGTLGTVQGAKRVNALIGQRSTTTAFAVIPAHGYSGTSITGFGINGSTYSFFNSVLGGTATALTGTSDTLSYTTGTVITGTANTVLVTSNSHELQSGDLITVTGGSQAGYNVTDAVVTRIDGNRFIYPSSAAITAANTGTLTITAKRRVNLSATDSPARSLSNGSGGAKSTATGITGTFVHNLSTAWKVDMSCANPSGFNITGAAVASVPNSTTFTYALTTSVTASTTATGTSTGTDYTGAACTGSILTQFRKTTFTTPAAVDAIADNGSGILATTPISATSDAVRTFATGFITAGRPSDQDTTARANIINWVRGQDNKQDENSNSSFTDIRASVHGDVLHSRPAVVNYNRFGDDNDVYAFYGSNDGMLHVLKAGSASSESGINPGDERWSFIPREFFSKLSRLRDNTPAVSSANPKPYFADGPITVYQKDVNGDGQLTPSGGDKVYVYAAFHRGGQFLYAFDATDPAAPKLLWRKTNADSGYSELAQTWSSPQVTKLAANIGNAANPENVVLIFGAGYDPNVDDVNPCLLQKVDPTSITLKPGATGTVDYSTPVGSCTIGSPTGSPTTRARSMGRGVLIVDAFNGNVVWQAGPSPSGAANNVTVPGMTCSIASDVTAIDFDRNGTVDFIYAGDTCANLWRIDVSDSAIGNWQVNKLAALSGTSDTDILNQRKFLFPADAVASNDLNGNFIAVLIGSGDRQHAFDTSIQDRFYMIKDRTVVGATPPATISDSQLFDATTSNGVNDFGWKMGFGLGEKDVGGTVTLGGTTFFNTNQPSSTAGGGACGSNLGIARQYSINFADAGATADLNSSGFITTADRARIVAGGGFLPSPVPATVEIGGKKYQVVISGTQVQQPPGATLDTRSRTYWYREYE